MKKLMAILRSRGGLLTILGVICVLVGPSIGTIAAAASNGILEVAGVVILLAGYVMTAIGLVMIVVAARRARGQEGPNKT